MIRLLLCDDHALLRAGLVRALRDDPRLAVVAEAQTRAQLLQWLRSPEEADILLLDLSLDAGGVARGIELIEDAARARPLLPIIVVSMHNEAELVGRAMQAGAKGYVTKGSAMQVLIDAILQVHGGHHFLSPELVQPMLQHRPPPAAAWSAELTPREHEVMQLICSGKRLSDIAAEWGVSIKTVSTHKVRLMEKLNLASNADLIKLGVRNGMG